MDMIIKNGTVVTATGMFKADIAVENGKIAAIGNHLSGDDETMTECFKRRNALCAPDAAVDYSFHIGVKDIHGELLESIKEACDMGITS